MQSWSLIWRRKVFLAALTLELLALSMVLFTDLSATAALYAMVGIAVQVFLDK
jgi:heme/copper-type cytochrome/quinol oxidase subunit 4